MGKRYRKGEKKKVEERRAKKREKLINRVITIILKRMKRRALFSKVMVRVFFSFSSSPSRMKFISVPYARISLLFFICYSC